MPPTLRNRKDGKAVTTSANKVTTGSSVKESVGNMKRSKNETSQLDVESLSSRHGQLANGGGRETETEGGGLLKHTQSTESGEAKGESTLSGAKIPHPAALPVQEGQDEETSGGTGQHLQDHAGSAFDDRSGTLREGGTHHTQPPSPTTHVADSEIGDTDSNGDHSDIPKPRSGSSSYLKLDGQDSNRRTRSLPWYKQHSVEICIAVFLVLVLVIFWIAYAFGAGIENGADSEANAGDLRSPPLVDNGRVRVRDDGLGLETVPSQEKDIWSWD